MGFYFLDGLMRFLGLIPLRVLYVFTDISYFILVYVLRYRRKVIMENLEASFPEKTDKELRRIARRYYRHMCNLAAEICRFRTMPEREIKRRCRILNTGVIRDFCDRGKSVICLLAHYGNWEWLSSMPLHMEGMKFLPLYKPLRNKGVDRMMLKVRSRFGAEPLPKNRVLRVMARHISAGSVFIGGFIADQLPHREGAHWMDFLNRDTPVFIGAEKIADKFSLPVVVLCMERVKRGYYTAEFLPLKREGEKKAPGEITETYMRMLEARIRENPEYWLWSHKRWKYGREWYV